MSQAGQLGGLHKSAGKLDLLWQGVKSLYRHGAWPTLERVAARGSQQAGRLGQLSSGVQSAARLMNGPLGTGLSIYGASSMLEPITGISLPGSELAFNLGMPIIGGMNTAANLITAGRASTPAMQEKIRQDAQAGARAAGADFLTSINADPRVAFQPGRYGQFLKEQGVDVPEPDSYLGQQPKIRSWWGNVREAATDPDKLINERVREEAAAELNKKAGAALNRLAKNVPGVLGKLFGATHHVVTPLMVGSSVYGLGKSILSDKPYDEAAVSQAGYDAGQVGIQQNLNKLGPMQRMALRLDPSFAVSEVEKALPGTIQTWEHNTGARYQPGLLSSVVNYLKPGGPTRFYSTDAAGNQDFIN